MSGSRNIRKSGAYPEPESRNCAQRLRIEVPVEDVHDGAKGDSNLAAGEKTLTTARRAAAKLNRATPAVSHTGAAPMANARVPANAGARPRYPRESLRVSSPRL